MSKTKLTVWVFTSEFAPHLIGGLGTVATHLTNAYSRNNRATVLTENRFRQLKIEKRGQLKIIRFPSKTIAHTDPVVIHRWLTRRGYKLPSCIHIHSLVYARLAQYYRKQFRIPVVYTCHSLVALEKGTGGRKRASVNKQQRILKIADRIVVPSRRERQKLRRLYPFAGKKTVVIRHGVFTKSTMNTGQAHELLFVGRLISSKGIEPLLHAIALLKRKNKKVNLTVAGTGSRGYLAHLKSVVRKHGISSNVRWVGFRTPKQVRRMYASYGAVIMPSRSESFGLVALEALANGIPLVATRAGGLSEFVSDDVAQTIPKVEKKAIAASIERMWNNKKLTKKRVAAGRKLTLQYKWPRVAKQYLRLFRLVREETRTLKRR